MADFDRIEVSATLNIPDATSQIKADLKTIEASLSPININAKINTDTIKNQTQQVEHAFNNIKPKNIKVNFDDIETKAKRLSQTINEITSKFSNINLNSNWSAQVESTANNVFQLKTNLDNFNKANVGIEKIQAFNTLKNSVQDTKKQVNDLFKAQQSLANVNITSNKFESYLKENSQVADKFPTKVNAIRTSLASLNNETDTTKLVTGLQDANKQFSELKTSAEEAGIEGRTALQEIGNDVKKMLSWTVGGTLIFGSVREIKQGIQDIADLNSALTTISMTTNATKTQLYDLGISAVTMAKQLGTSVSNVTDVAEIYANMKDSISSIMEKSKPTVLLSTASGMTGSEAADTLQAITNQFNLADSSATHLADSIEKISANMKVDFKAGIEDISNAVKDSGSLANEAGLSYEKFAGIIGATVEKTRLSGDQIGNAFKTIIARISRANSGDASVDEISKADKAFQSIGVHVRDSSGQFKDLSTTLDAVASKWGSLTSVQKSYVAEQAAGVRQKSVFIGMMDSYTKSVELTTDALNSNGFAEQTNEKYTQSITAKVNSFKDSVTKLWTTLISSDAIKTVVDGGTSIVNVITTINDKLGAMPTLIATVAAALSGIKNVGRIYAYAA